MSQLPHSSDSSQGPPGPPRPPLRLFIPGQSDAPPPDTLRACYNRWLKPDHERDASQATLAEYETTLRHWEKLLGNPGVATIATATVDAFADRLAAEPTIESAGTVNKHLRNLRTILRRCVPQGVSPCGQTHGEHVLDWLPQIRMRREEHPQPRAIEMDELRKIHAACHGAKLARRTSAAASLVWKTILRTGYTFGLRTNDLMMLPRSALSFDPRCPHPRLKKLQHPQGWFGFVATKTRRYKPYTLYLPIPARLRQDFDLLLSAIDRGRLFAAQPTDRLFPVGRRANDWGDAWKSLQRAAGIEEPLYLLKELRQTCATVWNDVADGLGEHVLGHAKLSVNARHYDQATRRLLQHVEEFPYWDETRADNPRT